MISKLLSSALGSLLVLCALNSLLYSQDEDRGRDRYGEQGRSREQSAADVVSFEPQMFAIDSASVRVDILFRVRFDFFVFTRDPSTLPVSFRAHGELMIELTDSTDSSVSRKVQTIILKTIDNELTQLRRQYYQGAASFVVRPGRYTAVYRIDDRESRREFADRKEILRVPDYRKKELVRSTLLFVEPLAEPASEKSFTAVNDNNAAQKIPAFSLPSRTKRLRPSSGFPCHDFFQMGKNGKPYCRRQQPLRRCFGTGFWRSTLVLRTTRPFATSSTAAPPCQ